MNTQTPQYIEEDEIDLRELWNVLAKRKYFIALITLAITLLAGVYAFTKTPMYEAKALIEIGNYKLDNNNNNNKVLLDNPSQLSKKLSVIFIDSQKSVKNKEAEISSIDVPKKSNSFVAITSLAISNELARTEINKVVSYIQNKDNLILKDVKNRRELEIKNIDVKIANIKDKEVSLIDAKIILLKSRLDDKTMQLQEITSNINQTKAANPTLAALMLMKQDTVSNLIFGIANTIMDLKNKKDLLISTSINDLIEKKNLVQSMLLPHNYKNSQVVAKILTSDNPVKPKKKLIVVVAFVTGLILSIFLVFFLEFIATNKED